MNLPLSLGYLGRPTPGNSGVYDLNLFQGRNKPFIQGGGDGYMV